MNKHGIITEIIIGVLIMIIGTFVVSQLGWNNVVVQVSQLTEQKNTPETNAGSSSGNTFLEANYLPNLFNKSALDIFQYVTAYIARLVIDYGAFVLLIAIVSGLRAPFIAFRLIRRNRQLGRDIYREIAQADRFMDIWNAEIPMLSDDSQHHWAFVPNGNRQAANLNRVDGELAKLKLIELLERRDPLGDMKQYAQRRCGSLLVRNSLVYAFLLFFRVTFLGDRFSHIASGNGRISILSLQRIYWEVFALILTALVFVLILLGKLIP